MRKLIFIILLMFYAFSIKAQQNLILNGSFEINNPVSAWPCTGLNSSNVSDVIVYQGLDVGFIKDSCLICSPPTYWGGGAAEGHWFVEIISQEPQMITGEAISLKLSIPLDNEKNYKLSFSVRKPPLLPLLSNGCSDAKNNYIKVGISSYNNQFGTHLYTSPLGSDEWQEYSVIFNTQMAEEYVTVEVGIGDTLNWAAHIDNFVLVETTEQPNAIYEINNNKQLLKIVDILGRESEHLQKGLLFYIYSDGTVEKKLIIE